MYSNNSSRVKLTLGAQLEYFKRMCEWVNIRLLIKKTTRVLSNNLYNNFPHLPICRFLSPAAEEACQYVTGIVGKNPLLLRELNLSEHELGDTRVNQITALLRDRHCKLNTLT